MSNALSGCSRCDTCRLPADLCFCAELVALRGPVEVTLVVNHREIHRKTNTAKLFQACYPQAELVLQGGEIPEYRDKESLLLYPHEHAEALPLAIPSATPHLIVPDGTWPEVRRIARRLHKYRSVCLPPGLGVGFPLRANSPEDGTATMAALGVAMGLLGDPFNGDAVLSVYERMVAAMLRIRGVSP